MEYTKNLYIIFMMSAMLCAAVPIHAVEDEYQTLKLVQTYASEDEVLAAYPELHPPQISDNGESLVFSRKDAHTVQQKIHKKELTLTEQEQQALERKTPVVKQGTYYTLSEHRDYLIVTAFTAAIRHRERSGKSDIQRKTLYNAYGEAVTELPLDAEFIEAFPDRQHLLVFNLGGDPESTKLHSLYFYTTDGTLLTTHDVQGKYEKITFSKNGQYLGLYHAFASLIRVFDKTGHTLYDGDYRNFVHDKNVYLSRLFVSDDGQMMLLGMCCYRMYLCTMSGNILWEQNLPAVTDAWFFSKQQKLLVSVSNQDHTYDALMLSLHDGSSIETISHISSIIMVQDHLIILKEGVYYEYTVD